jgi:hypothetical protein
MDRMGRKKLAGGLWAGGAVYNYWMRDFASYRRFFDQQMGGHGAGIGTEDG